jgi:glycerate dehydrogenase
VYKVTFLDHATIAPDVNLPSPSFAHKWTNFAQTDPTEIISRASHTDIIVNNKVKLGANILAELGQLKHIAIAATGTNCVDLSAASKLGISVSNVPRYATQSVSEHVIATILGLRRNLFAFKADIAAGKWQQANQFCFHNAPILDISNSTLGLIGTGAIAQQVARLAKAFGMKVIYHSVSAREEFTGETLVSLEQLLTQSDVVSIHCPLTDATENLIDAPQIAVMQKHALLINTARGSIVNLQALHNALINKKIAGAGIDVAPQEPPEHDSPIMHLNALSNCIVTPHTAWASQQASKLLLMQVVDNLEAFVKGEPINIVN